MQESQPLGGADGDLKPGTPRQGYRASYGVKQLNQGFRLQWKEASYGDRNEYSLCFSRLPRTPEKMILQASSWHELVHQQPVLVFAAVADQFHQIMVPQPPQEEDLRLQQNNEDEDGDDDENEMKDDYDLTSHSL